MHEVEVSHKYHIILVICKQDIQDTSQSALVIIAFIAAHIVQRRFVLWAAIRPCEVYRY